MAFEGADIVFIPEPPMMEKIPPEERFSSLQLVDHLKERGLKAFYSPDTNQLLDRLVLQCRENDVVLIMSNGAFDNLHQKLLKRLDNL